VLLLLRSKRTRAQTRLEAKKPHQGIFSKNRRLRVGAVWAKWSGTHQDRKCSWSKTVSGSALDANGNTTTDSSGKSYTWDFENRLISAAVPGKGTVTFKYDPFGRRIQKTSPWRTITYLYDGDGDNVNEEVAGNGNVLNRFTHTQNIDEPLSGTMSGTISYYEQDAPGSITSVSNPSGTLADTYVYDSFGKLTTSTGTLLNSFRYTGHEFDTETGLYYYRSRYYDDTAGRFISEDPIRFKGGINFYAYVKNNPIVHTDPLGLAPGGTCTCTGSGGKPFAGVCFGYTCECSCETQPEPAAFTMNGLRRDCGWAEKRCPMVVEATSDPRMYGSIVENLHAVKCYDTRPQ
jgi:RHS repeat-associated protein